jgi:uncharacterized protein
MIFESEIEQLERYLEQRKDLAFAFLFGSEARGTARKHSDIDLAVYFIPPQRAPVEFEDEVYYPGEQEIWDALEALLHREVELLVLNRAPAPVAAGALRGRPLVIRDWGLFLPFMEVVTGQAEDFMNLVIEDFNERTSLEKRN